MAAGVGSSGFSSLYPVTSFAEAKKWFNYGQVEVTQHGKLAAKIITTEGTVAYTLEP
ncbi:MAG: hypothetical protein ABI036_12910 [Fibrobacteria bacterium]